MTTYQGRRRWSKERKQAISNALLRSWRPGGAHHERFHNCPADADTMRWRFLQDRMGNACGRFAVGGIDHEIRHSWRRSDAYDLVLDGRVVATGGRVAIGRALAALLP